MTNNERFLMFKYLLTASIAGSLLVGGVALAGNQGGHEENIKQEVHKINICHRTDNEKNPLVAIQIAVQSWSTHKAHGDFMYGGPTEYGKPTRLGSLWCVKHQPLPKTTPSPSTSPETSPSPSPSISPSPTPSTSQTAPVTVTSLPDVGGSGRTNR